MVKDLNQEREIRLEKRNLKDADIETTLTQILKDSKSLEILSLHENHLTLANGELTSGVAASTTLQELDVGDNQINVEGAERLAEAMKENKLLTTLRLVGNQIGDDGCKFMAGALTCNTIRLQQLSLCDNILCNLGATRLADAMTNNTTLLMLDMSCNAIGDGGAEKLANALLHNTTLRELNLGCNQIGDEGAEAIASALIQNKSLRKLWLNSNKIDDDGANKLIQGLKLNFTVTEFWFNGNPMSVKFYLKMLRVLEDRRSGKIKRLP